MNFVLVVSFSILPLFISPVLCYTFFGIIEINWQTGVKNLIIFGSAGSLDSKATDGRYPVINLIIQKDRSCFI